MGSKMVRAGENPCTVPAESRIRGINYHKLALEFVETFPVGTTIQAKEFDKWCHARGLLNYPDGADKKSDVWKAHLQRRHEWRYKINTAGTHSRMKDRAFTIESQSQGVFCVLAPQAALALSSVPAQLNGLLVTKRKQLAYLMQSADWALLEPAALIHAEMLYDSISDFGATVALEMQHLERKFLKLRAHVLRVGEAAGNNTNGGIRAFLGNGGASDEE